MPLGVTKEITSPFTVVESSRPMLTGNCRATCPSMVTVICFVASSTVAIFAGPMVRLSVRSVSPYIPPPRFSP